LKSPTTLTAADHAFANGFVFEEPASREAALAALRDKVLLVDERDADLLVGVWRQFRDGGEIGPNVRLALAARLINLGETRNVRLHGDCALRGILKVETGGKLEIGRFCYLGDGVLVSVKESVTIGEATLLAHGVQVFDNNTHPTSAAQRELQFRRMIGHKDRTGPMVIESAPVTIGRRCWIGMNSIVMKGVSIGDDTIVASGSVVVSSLPEGVIAGGNPARVLRDLTPEEREP
jgi:acetyltransferase-like isoleucine patch superfamily enzyme